MLRKIRLLFVGSSMELVFETREHVSSVSRAHKSRVLLVHKTKSVRMRPIIPGRRSNAFSKQLRSQRTSFLCHSRFRGKRSSDLDNGKSVRQGTRKLWEKCLALIYGIGQAEYLSKQKINQKISERK